MKWIKNLIIKYRLWKLKRKYKQLELTPQGQYFIKYIIDYYINYTTYDTIERYENKIIELSKYIELPPQLKEMPEIFHSDLLHLHSAITLLRVFLMISPKKQEWLDSIKREEIKKIASQPIYII